MSITDGYAQSDHLGELAKALAAAQGELEPVHKTATNPFFKSKYADLPAVLAEYKRVFPKHGLSVAQVPLFFEGGVGLHTLLLHTSGQWLGGTCSVRTKDPMPQTLGSALTYLRRYALSSICGISSDDDDGEATRSPVATKPAFDKQLFAKMLVELDVPRPQWERMAELCRPAAPQYWRAMIQDMLSVIKP